MRSALVGAVESSLTALRTLIEHEAAPRLVVSLPRGRSGRHSDHADLRPTAAAAGIPVHETVDVNDPSTLDALAAEEPDVIFVVGWSQICRSEFLGLPAQGVIGYHPSALPENRGRAVIPWTIIQGAEHTGSTLFWLDDGVDTGDVLTQDTFPVDPRETARTLYDKHLASLRQMLRRTLPALRAGRPERTPQDHAEATYCARRRPEDGVIDWSAPAHEVDRLVRATGDPYPGAFSSYRDGRLTIWSCEHVGPAPYWGLPGQVQALQGSSALVQCGDRGHVLVGQVQLDDGPRRSAGEVLGLHDRLGPLTDRC